MYYLTTRPSKKNKKDMVIIKESEDLQKLKLLGALANPSAVVEIYADRKKVRSGTGKRGIKRNENI